MSAEARIEESIILVLAHSCHHIKTRSNHHILVTRPGNYKGIILDPIGSIPLPGRCTPIRCTPVSCTPMRCTPHEIHAREMDADEVHAYKVHANEMHGREIHARL